MTGRSAIALAAVVLAAAALRGHRADAVQICPEGVCRPLSCSGAFAGWATWQQDVALQSDDQQDELMNQACGQSFPGSRAATTRELAEHCIPGLPSTNASGEWLMGRCPDCAGRGGWSPPPVSGHCRSCVGPGDPMPSELPPHPSWHDYCCSSRRSAACVR